LGKLRSDYSVGIAAAVNDERILQNNLAASPILQDVTVPLLVERGHASAAMGYNHALDVADAEIVVFVHQDVYLPRGWKQRLELAVGALERTGKNWAVLGVIGLDLTGNIVGRSWSNGLQREVGGPVSSPVAVQSVDEIVIVLKKATGIHFDESLPGFHLYGTDIVQTAIAAGYEAYVFDGPVVHNSLPVRELGSSYRLAYRYMRCKWKAKLPILTPILPITRTEWPLVKRWCKEKKNSFARRFKPLPRPVRCQTPSGVARQLNYDVIVE